MSFVYDLMEWVHPGTIHKYASTDQRKLQATSSSPKKSDVLASTVTNSVGGPSSSLTAGGPRTLDGLDGNDG